MNLDEVFENGIQALLRFDFPAARAQFAAAADAQYKTYDALLA